MAISRLSNPPTEPPTECELIDGEVTLRARWVVPISGPPIENGFVVVSGGRVVRVGQVPQSQPVADGSVKDLGDVAVLPGLVNAHTHLEFSDLDAPIGNPGMELAEWIVQVVRARREALSRAPDVLTPRTTVAQGVSEALASGTALIGEIASTPWPGGDSRWDDQQAITVVAFAEVLGLTPERAAEKFALAREHVDSIRPFSGVSPHAPYSTPLELISRCIELAVQVDCPLAMHVAESPAERELLTQGTGPFAENLTSLGFDVAKMFPWRQAEPIQTLIELLARAPASLLVHGNDLQPHEIACLAEHPLISVVYCPRTHAFFGHARHPVADLIAAGVNVALGTDSRASNPDLQLWREVRHLLNHRQDLLPATVLEMATLAGARAMRQDDRYGTIAPGRAAAFASVPTTAADVETLYADFASLDASSAAALQS